MPLNRATHLARQQSLPGSQARDPHTRQMGMSLGGTFSDRLARLASTMRTFRARGIGREPWRGLLKSIVQAWSLGGTGQASGAGSPHEQGTS